MRQKLSIIGLCIIILIPLIYSFANNNVYGQRIARAYLNSEVFIPMDYANSSGGRHYQVRIARLDENRWYFTISALGGGAVNWAMLSGLPDRELFLIPVRSGFNMGAYYKINPHSLGIEEAISLDVTMFRAKSGNQGLEIAAPIYIDFYTSYSVNRRHGDFDYGSLRTYLSQQDNIAWGREMNNHYIKQENLNVPDGYYVFDTMDYKIFAIHKTTGKIIYKNSDRSADLETWHDFDKLDPIPVPEGFIPFGVSSRNNETGNMHYGVAAYRETETSVDIAFRRDIDSDWKIASMNPFPKDGTLIKYNIHRYDLTGWPSSEFEVPKKFTPVRTYFRNNELAVFAKADYDYQWVDVRFSYNYPYNGNKSWTRRNPIDTDKTPDMPYADYRLTLEPHMGRWLVLHESLGKWDSKPPNPPSDLQPSNNSYSTSKTVTVRWTYEHPEGLPSSGVRIQRSQFSNFSGATDTGELSSRTSYAFNNLPEGNNYFRVMVKDSNGNWSDWSNPIRVIVDTIPPTSPSITISY